MKFYMLHCATTYAEAAESKTFGTYPQIMRLMELSKTRYKCRPDIYLIQVFGTCPLKAYIQKYSETYRTNSKARDKDKAKDKDNHVKTAQGPPQTPRTANQGPSRDRQSRNNTGKCEIVRPQGPKQKRKRKKQRSKQWLARPTA